MAYRLLMREDESSMFVLISETSIGLVDLSYKRMNYVEAGIVVGTSLMAS